MENCDVQFWWWETVSVMLLHICCHHWGIWRKEKTNPCENNLMTFLKFSLAVTSELSDLGQIKKQRLFPQGSTPLPFLLARSEWHWLCTGLARRREIEGDFVLWSPAVLHTGDLIRVCRLLFHFKFKYKMQGRHAVS